MDKKETLQANVAIDTENSIQQVWDSVFAVSPEVIEKFGRDVEKLATTKTSYPKPIRLQIPHVYLALNNEADNLRIEEGFFSLDRFTLQKSMGKVVGKQDEAHSLTLEDMKSLPIYIANPLLIIRDTDRSIVSILDIKNSQGQEFSAIFHLEKRQKHGVVTDIASIYARDDVARWLRKREDKIIYFRQEKSRESSQQSQPIGRIDSLLGVGALQRLVANRSESSFSTENKILNSEDVVNFYLKKIAQKEEPIINLTGLCPREAGRKLFEATQGNLVQWALIERSAAAVGMTVDKKALEAAQGKNKLIIQEVMMKAVTLKVKTITNSKSKTTDRERQ